MGKKNLTKSEKQLQILVDYYQSSDGLWEREQLEILAEKLDLTRQQVYKWLWDQKKIQVKKSMNEGLLREEGVNKKDDSMEDQNQQFTYGNGIGKIRASSRIQQAVEFIVHTSVSSWAMNVLRNEGWQFVMESSRNTNLDEVVHIFDEEMMEVEEQIQIKEEEFQPVLQEIQVPEMKGLVKQEEQDFQMILVELNPPEVKQFEVVNEDIQPDFPFLKVKAKEEEMFDDDLSWRSVKRYILNKEKGDSDVKGKKRQKIVMKDIASSEEIFDSKS